MIPGPYRTSLSAEKVENGNTNALTYPTDMLNTLMAGSALPDHKLKLKKGFIVCFYAISISLPVTVVHYHASLNQEVLTDHTCIPRVTVYVYHVYPWDYSPGVAGCRLCPRTDSLSLHVYACIISLYRGYCVQYSSYAGTPVFITVFYLIIIN